MKPVLITGSAQRLGAVAARMLKEAGWQPIIHYNGSHEPAEALAKDLGTIAIQGDLGDTTVADTLVAKAAAAIGHPLAGLVNCASIFVQDRPEAPSPDLLYQHFAVNTAAPALLAARFAAQARAADGPVIVNVLDQKLRNLHPDFFSYTLSKAALETASTLMAQAFAPTIRVCGVAPGYHYPAPGQDEASFLARADKVNALQRRLDPEAIAHAIKFCFENQSITGQTIVADNGEHMVPTTRDVSLTPDP